MTYATATVSPAKPVQELTVVEISFYDHEIHAASKLIARITYDGDDFVTQRWVVRVNGKEIFRAIAYMKCHDYVTWHYKQKTLPVQEPETPTTTTDNEVMVQIADECDKLGLELLDDGIYQGDEKLGEVGCTNGKWWVVPALSGCQIQCDSAMDAVWSLSESCEELLDIPFDQLTAHDWQRIRKYEAVVDSWEFVAA